MSTPTDRIDPALPAGKARRRSLMRAPIFSPGLQV